MPDAFSNQVEGIGALAEPVRRSLYLYVVGQPEPVSRDEAAAGVDVARHTAKFHLDRLVEEGLLDVEYRRLSGRQGPGAGRPSKLYRRSTREFTVSIPERRYRLAGDILAAALDQLQRDAMPIPDEVARSAHEAGQRIGAAAREGGRPMAGASPLDRLVSVLAEEGYEPRAEGDGVILANCPFHELARSHTDLVCGMNVELICAVRDELGQDEVEVRLQPGEGRCCVTLGMRS